MAERRTTTRTTAAARSSKGFTAEERAAMKERAKELKSGSKASGESDVLAKIAEMSDADRAIAERVHAIVTKTAPDLEPRTWYGMPAYSKDGSVVCHFKPALKFKTRYATLGFSDKASLDEGSMWPVEFAVQKLTAGVEKQIAALVRQATA
jgi:uncharacterized protein YdhG (YjbR/CyaY superfamily)